MLNKGKSGNPGCLSKRSAFVWARLPQGSRMGLGVDFIHLRLTWDRSFDFVNIFEDKNYRKMAILP
jgi:hypothetical protein